MKQKYSQNISKFHYRNKKVQETLKIASRNNVKTKKGRRKKIQNFLPKP
jgi:hypothetical protein